MASYPVVPGLGGYLSEASCSSIYEPPHEKTAVFGVGDQLRLKPTCSADETS